MHQIWRLQLFNGLRAVLGDQHVTRFRTQKTAALLAYMAYFPGLHSREVLIELLWPDSSLESGRNNLRIALSSLRRQLEPPGVPAGSIVVGNRNFVGLNEKLITSDVVEFQSAIRQADKAPRESIRQIEQLHVAMELYQGPLLKGIYESWVPAEELRLEELYVRAQCQMSAHLQRSKRFGAALELAHRLGTVAPSHALDPIETERLAHLARQSIDNSDDSDGAPHSPEMALIRPPQESTTKSDNLPLELTRFFGRNRELARLEELFGSMSSGSGKSSRLVTLTGTGGSGKTRLGLEFARQFRDSPAGRDCAVRFVALGEATDQDMVLSAVRDAIRLPVATGLPVIEQVIKALSETPTLLLLDNFEQVIPTGQPLVRTLLERVPSLSMLVTSRQRLGIAGERELAVAPLPTPAVNELSKPVPLAQPPGGEIRELLMSNESVQLFVDRAQSVRPDFQLTKTNAIAVAELCARLEGIPLALELAAARIQTCPPAKMLEELNRHFHQHSASTLINRQRDTTERHRSLAATLDWSFQLLPEGLGRFFTSLCVFRGGWTLKAAQAVTGEPLSNEYLAYLMNCSLVVPTDHGMDLRFHMLETLRSHAAEQLSTHDRSVLWARHAQHYLEMAESVAPVFEEVAAPGGEARVVGILERLNPEQNNFRVALSRSIENAPEPGLRMALALWRYWEIRGHYREGRAFLLAAVENNSAAPAALRARALQGAAKLGYYQGDFGAIRSILGECLPLLRSDGDCRGEAMALSSLGIAAMNMADFKAAYSYFEDGLALARELDDRKLMQELLGHYGVTLAGEARFDEALPMLEESLALARVYDDLRGLADALHHLAVALWLKGDSVRARPLIEESIAIFRNLDAPWNIAHTLWSLASIERIEGNIPEAYRASHESLRIFYELDNKWSACYLVESLAYLAIGEGRMERAAKLLGGAELLRQTMSANLLPIDHMLIDPAVAQVKCALRADVFAANWGKGRKLPWPRLVALALERSP